MERVFSWSMFLVLCVQFFATATALTCYTCTDNQLRTDNDALDGILSKLSNEACRFENPEEDMYDVDSRQCPPAGRGKVNKCANVKGLVNAKFLSVIKVKILMQRRECIEVPEDDSNYYDGGHTVLPSSGPGRDFLDAAFSGTGLGSITFDGKAYYSSGDYSNSATGLTNSSMWKQGIIPLCLFLLLTMREWQI